MSLAKVVRVVVPQCVRRLQGIPHLILELRFQGTTTTRTRSCMLRLQCVSCQRSAIRWLQAKIAIAVTTRVYTSISNYNDCSLDCVNLPKGNSTVYVVSKMHHTKKEREHTLVCARTRSKAHTARPGLCAGGCFGRFRYFHGVVPQRVMTAQKAFNLARRQLPSQSHMVWYMLVLLIIVVWVVRQAAHLTGKGPRHLPRWNVRIAPGALGHGHYPTDSGCSIHRIGCSIPTPSVMICQRRQRRRCRSGR
jgi:hypothetical protein